MLLCKATEIVLETLALSVLNRRLQDDLDVMSKETACNMCACDEITKGTNSFLMNCYNLFRPVNYFTPLGRNTGRRLLDSDEE